LRQTPNRGNKSPPLAQFKDAADDNRGWLLATDPHDPTSRCLTSRRSACRSKSRKPGDCQQDNGGIEFQLTHPGAPLRRNTSIYWSGGDHRVSELARVECECCDDTNVEDGNKKMRPRERRRAGQE
ncbi:hypothetical protein T09_86, partial [Trichinella sp. T9]